MSIVKFWYTPWGVQIAAIPETNDEQPTEMWPIPSDWEEVTQAQYESRLAIIRSDPGAWKANVANAECQKHKDAFQDLHSTIPALDLETCYLLAGWRPGDC